jgi:MFS family permease
MSKKQLFALLGCNLVPWAVGNGLLPLLPVYATQLGVDAVWTGYFLSFNQFTLAVGCVVSGWLSDKLQRRKALLFVAGVLAIPTTWLMGQTTNIWYLATLAAILWFLLGVEVTLLSILTGLFAEETERGKAFGILGMTSALGSSIGSSMTGLIADRWGYQSLFAVAAMVLAILVLIGSLLEDRVVARDQNGRTSAARERRGLGRAFFLLLLVVLISGIAGFVVLMGRSLAMTELGFAAAAISIAFAITFAVSLPLRPLFGWLSDRVGRKRLMAVSYTAGAVGLLGLAVSESLWHFWVSASMIGILYGAETVGSALVTDLLPLESLGVGMSLYSATGFAAGILGFAGTGHAFQSLGMIPTFILGVFLQLIAIGLLILIRVPRREESASYSENSAA